MGNLDVPSPVGPGSGGPPPRWAEPRCPGCGSPLRLRGAYGLHRLACSACSYCSVQTTNGAPGAVSSGAEAAKIPGGMAADSDPAGASPRMPAGSGFLFSTSRIWD